jgi:hypothetical protein
MLYKGTLVTSMSCAERVLSQGTTLPADCGHNEPECDMKNVVPQVEAFLKN